MNQKDSRRQFLKGAVGGLGGMMAARTVRLFPEVEPLLAQRNQEGVLGSIPLTLSGAGELYGGFVLLPEGAPVPPYVQDYKFGIPTMCNVGDSESSGSVAIHKTVLTPKILSQQGGFAVYKLTTDVPTLQSFDIQFSDACLITHDTGEVFGGWVNYKTYDIAYKLRI